MHRTVTIKFIMNIKRISIQTKGFTIPGIMIESPGSMGMVIIIHGYGGTKEEQLGLGWRIAESGFSACMIDLPGHGENTDYFEGDIKSYVDSLTDYFKENNNIIVTLGHSLGGRLSLISNADYVIGLSPTLINDFKSYTKFFVKNNRSYRVRERDDEFLWSLFKELPQFDANNGSNALIIFGTRDIPEIVNSCRKAQNDKTKVIEIDEALHGDIYLNEKVFEIIINQLKQWI